jgi:hypothetical protein
LRILLETQAIHESVSRGDDAWEAQFAAAHHHFAKAEPRTTAISNVNFSDWEQRIRAFTRRCLHVPLAAAFSPGAHIQRFLTARTPSAALSADASPSALSAENDRRRNMSKLLKIDRLRATLSFYGG